MPTPAGGLILQTVRVGLGLGLGLGLGSGLGLGLGFTLGSGEDACRAVVGGEAVRAVD